MQKNQLLQLSEKESSSVSRKMVEALREPSYKYPWESLEEKLKRQKLSRLPLVAYGSLVNITSSAKTLRIESINRRRPVIAFGVRRLFNYEIPKNQKRYQITAKSIASAALNVRLTGNITDVLNGVLLEISLNDISAMRLREIGYDLAPVVCIDWEGNNKPPIIVYILWCPEDVRNGVKLTNDRIKPNPDYYLTCRNGAAELGEDFLRFWLATTYLADGETSVEIWESSFSSISARNK